MKHGYRHTNNVRKCDQHGCWLDWPCKKHGARMVAPSAEAQAKVKRVEHGAFNERISQRMEQLRVEAERYMLNVGGLNSIARGDQNPIEKGIEYAPPHCECGQEECVCDDEDGELHPDYSMRVSGLDGKPAEASPTPRTFKAGNAVRCMKAGVSGLELDTVYCVNGIRNVAEMPGYDYLEIRGVGARGGYWNGLFEFVADSYDDWKREQEAPKQSGEALINLRGKAIDWLIQASKAAGHFPYRSVCSNDTRPIIEQIDVLYDVDGCELGCVFLELSTDSRTQGYVARVNGLRAVMDEFERLYGVRG